MTLTIADVLEAAARLGPFGPLGLALIAGYAAHSIAFFVARRAVRHSDSTFDDLLVRTVRGPFRVLLPLLAVQVVLPSLALPDELGGVLRHLMALALIVVVAWLVIRSTSVAGGLIDRRWRLDVRDNLEAREIHTQFEVLRRVAVMVVVLVALAAILMTFPRVRQLGTSLLASAGIAGLALGMAARPALQNLIAGIQLALTQPIRIDDVVIVEGEWGRVEEIRTTFVVVRIWDERRLVVPLTYFIEHPFENWTRKTADLLGTVVLHADYVVDVDALRAELHRIVGETDLWDRKVCVLQVVDANDRTLELRALVSASDSGRAWDLRCLVRERLVAYLRAHQPGALPRARAEVLDARERPG